MPNWQHFAATKCGQNMGFFNKKPFGGTVISIPKKPSLSQLPQCIHKKDLGPPNSAVPKGVEARPTVALTRVLCSHEGAVDH
mmetsp:Transcript_83319/g.139013  ORF Transcript_83319/g.139013 Transcript_83319/m.139013 type:complete len:82 (-) Transcript_83319:196-441(-)